MKQLLRTIKERLFRLLPGPIRSILLSKIKSLTKIAPRKDHKVSFKNQFYGRVCLSLNPIYYIENMILYRHYYDKKTQLYYKRLVRNGDIVFDIGANMGSMTIPLANHAGPTGRVFSFEPGPVLFKRLETNVMLNPRLKERIECVQLGLSNQKGSLFWREEMSTVNRGNAYLSNDKTGTRVDIIELDTFVMKRNIQKLDFMKIDVEGMELEVIQGGANSIARFLPIILFETEPEFHEKTAQVFKILSDLSYKFFEIDVSWKALTNDAYAFNFIPTFHPNLPSDTLAVPDKHKSRIIK